MPPIRSDPGLVTVYVELGPDEWQAVIVRVPGTPTWNDAQRAIFGGYGREAISRALRYGSPPYVVAAENIAGPLIPTYPRIGRMHWTRHPALHHVEPIRRPA